MNINYLEYHRRLPHYQNANKIYDVTFVTKHRWVLPPAARSVVIDEITRMHDVEASIHCGVPMPDHVHVILQALFDQRGYP